MELYYVLASLVRYPHFQFDAIWSKHNKLKSIYFKFNVERHSDGLLFSPGQVLIRF